jgi:CubicO group peptidase (beta-lactamase class C family)
MLSALAALFAIAAVPASADALDDLMQRELAAAHVPGAAVAVVRNGKVTALRGYGIANLEWSAPAAPDTVFQLASSTKIVTGITLMRLVEQRRLGLDDPLGRFFPDLAADKRAITVRQLADHTSGLTEAGPTGDGSLAAVVAGTLAAPLDHPPGSRSRYGFNDFAVLRAVMEKAAGKGFEAIVRDELSVPLGLTDTGFNGERDAGPVRVSRPLERRASVYAWREGAQEASNFLYGEPGYAAGGLHSSARDLAAIFAALDRGALLSPAGLAALRTAPVLSDGTRGEFGIGTVVRRIGGRSAWGHSGGPALADVLRIEDETLTVIVLTNQQRLFPLLAERVLALELPRLPRAAVTDLQPELTTAVVGTVGELLAGRVEPGRFTAEGAKGVAGLAGFGPVIASSTGAVEGATPIANRPEGSGRRRLYEVRFQRGPMIWAATTDAAGRFTEIAPSDER